MQRVLSTVVLLGLLLATAAAFAITEHLKLIKGPLYDPQVTSATCAKHNRGRCARALKVFSPVCHCATDRAEISFKLRHTDSVTVSIVDSSSGDVVATIARAPTEPKDVALHFPWYGITTTGLAANGSVYQPQVELPGRTILMPNKITVDTSPPKVVSANDGAGLLISGGHGISIRYTFSEKAHAAVYLGHRRIVYGQRSRPSEKVKWNGKVGGKALRPGRYVLEVAAVDLAGNETPPAERKRLVVTIRYIALSETSIHVAPGARFAVKVRTGASQYTWKLAGKRGTAKKKVLHLRAPAHRGRYRLVVSEHGHATTGIVIVGRR